jgi:hypothetical protein
MDVHGIKRENGEKLLRSGASRIWFCDGCGKPFLWDGESRLWGSERDIENEDYHRIWVACCESCGDRKPAEFPKGIKRPKGSSVRVGGARMLPSDLPPGVMDCDFPGNTEDDCKWEGAIDWVADTGISADALIGLVRGWCKRNRRRIPKLDSSQ